MRITWTWFLLLALADLVLPAQNIQFYREDLNFKLSENHFTVDGFYFFCNTSKDTGKIVLHYPFPMDKQYGEIDSVEIMALPEMKAVSYSSSASGVSFPVKVDPFNAKKYRIKYRQLLSGTKAEYILTTTQSWRRPLEQANYTLTIPLNLEIDSLSYQADTMMIRNNSKNYSWQMKEFLPDKNMKIYFHQSACLKKKKKK